MALVLTDEQELLKDTAREFVQERSPVTRLRALRDEQDETGFGRDLWKEMGELGWTGILLPEEVGGSDLGYAELGVLLEELGRTLVPEPFLSTVVLGAGAISLAGSDAQKAALLPGIASGERVMALALQERGRFAPYDVSTKAEATGSGFRVTGEKRFVLDGHVADDLLVVARTSGSAGERDGLTLFLVDPASDSVRVTRTIMVDSRNAARVQLDGVEIDAAQVVGQVDRAADVLDPLLDRATIALSAELFGTLSEAYERTLEYLKTREQFGVKIGTFQALKHRAANLFCEVELCKSIVMEALRAIDEGRPNVAQLASAAKARVSDTAALVSCEAVQIFAGIGMTDEEEIGFFLKRARAAEITFGDAAYHRDRFATLAGY
ncbi:MAG: acyl-CoA dehydrogenase family protein [Deltaproteobacteria bacterium]|nr:acyl-CoA dehydrogenase family protein [Deltaproteobacteria bacterium]